MALVPLGIQPSIISRRDGSSPGRGSIGAHVALTPLTGNGRPSMFTTHASGRKERFRWAIGM